MKTKEELNALKNEVKDLNAKLAELSEDELKQVSGGYLIAHDITIPCPSCGKNMTIKMFTADGDIIGESGICACGYKHEWYKSFPY